MKCLRTVYIICLLFAASAFLLPAQPRSTGYPDLDLYYSQMENNHYKDDVARLSRLMETAPHDDIIMNYIERGQEVAHDTVSLFSFYNAGPVHPSKEKRLQLLDDMYEAARRNKSKELELLADYFKAWMMEGFRDEPFEARMDAMERIIRRSRKAGNDYLEILALEEMKTLTNISTRYVRSFVYSQRLEDALDKSGDDIHLKWLWYTRLGRMYYDSKDYDRALPLLYKALSHKKENAIVWNYLASYHKMKGDLDSAAYYNRAILITEEGLSDKPVFLSIAICNLGRIELARGNYDAAVAMLEAGLQDMKQQNDLSFVMGVYTSLGKAWLGKGRLPMAKNYIDSVYIQRNKITDETWQQRAVALFQLESRYYARKGRHELSKTYLDSVLVASQNYQKYVGRHNILLGEQMLKEAEIELKSNQLARQRNVIMFVVIILLVITVSLILLIRLYRKKNTAYKALARKAEEWARDTDKPGPDTRNGNGMNGGSANGNGTNGNSLNGNGQPTEEDRRIMSLAELEMTERFAYRDAGMSAELLADRLGIHRNALSRAVNRLTGGNYYQYINGYRIKEAVRLISQNGHKDLYIDELYERVGFNNRSSFYRAFKQFTGLSPAEFQKNATSANKNRQIDETANE